MTKYIATEASDYTRTENSNYIVTEDSTSNPTPPPPPPPPPPVVVNPCPSVDAYITSVTFLAGGTTTPIVSGYTYATPVVCKINIPVNYSPAFILNNYSLYVSFGTGDVFEITQVTSSQLLSQPFTYDWPGTYEIKLSVIPKNGCPPKIFVNTFKVFNYITDNISWDYSRWPDLTYSNRVAGALYHGYQSCPPGPLLDATPLTFNYTVSNRVSSDIVFNFYSKNSLSQPWDVATPDNKYAKLRPRWRFSDLNGNAGPALTAINVNPVYVAYTVSGGTINYTTTATADTGILVGYVGTVDFYYVDDLPTLYYKNGWSIHNIVPPTLWVTYKTKDIPDLQYINDGFVPSYSNSTIYLTAGFYVKNLTPDHFNITVNGGGIVLPKTVWADTDNQFIVTVNSPVLASSDFSNKVLLNYPQVGAVYETISAYVTPASAATVYIPSFTLSRYDSLGRDIGGFFKDIFSTLPLSAISTTEISATLTVYTSRFTTVTEPPAAHGYYSVAGAYSGSVDALNYEILSGTADFNVVNFYNKYFVRKINEDFNYGAQLQSYALQDFIANDTNLITFLSAIAGDNVHPSENFGTVAYEKIANFVVNNGDLSVSNVSQLYSLAKLIDVEFDNYNFDIPPVLKRQFDLYSTSHEQLWGTREKYNTNFNVLTDHTNLGVQLTAYNTNTTVTAGQKIVLNDIFYSSFYELIEVPAITTYASVTANNMQAYFPPASALTFPLTSYPLSSFFGWGLKTPVLNNYRFYMYNPSVTNVPVNNLIDWNQYPNSLSTTLSESVSSLSAWYADGGILENIYNYYILKGLNLAKSKYYNNS